MYQRIMKKKSVRFGYLNLNDCLTKLNNRVQKILKKSRLDLATKSKRSCAKNLEKKSFIFGYPIVYIWLSKSKRSCTK